MAARLRCARSEFRWNALGHVVPQSVLSTTQTGALVQKKLHGPCTCTGSFLLTGVEEPKLVLDRVLHSVSPFMYGFLDSKLLAGKQLRIAVLSSGFLSRYIPLYSLSLAAAP